MVGEEANAISPINLICKPQEFKFYMYSIRECGRIVMSILRIVVT
jgi:hypothetical protein